ncbi:hypothetical protein [Olivibacter ginsenosidimutans]|uniref:hypothetical protein n=1 Tax=Olivibacter ginsenosidimutans TaxID=1176537 RepID=UPI0031EAC29E
MNYKKYIYFLLLFLIAGFAYTQVGFGLSYRLRPLIGYLLLAGYLFGVGLLLYTPLSYEPKLKKHFLIRLTVLTLVALIILTPYWVLKQQHDSLGAGYLFFFMSIGFSTLIAIYTAVETIWLFTRKKYSQVFVNLLLAEGIYCLVLFSGLFGF